MKRVMLEERGVLCVWMAKVSWVVFQRKGEVFRVLYKGLKEGGGLLAKVSWNGFKEKGGV